MDDAPPPTHTPHTIRDSTEYRFETGYLLNHRWFPIKPFGDKICPKEESFWRDNTIKKTLGVARPQLVPKPTHFHKAMKMLLKRLQTVAFWVSLG